MKLSEMKRVNMWRGEPESYVGQLYFHLLAIHIQSIKHKLPPASVLGLYMARDRVCCCHDMSYVEIIILLQIQVITSEVLCPLTKGGACLSFHASEPVTLKSGGLERATTMAFKWLARLQ